MIRQPLIQLKCASCAFWVNFKNRLDVALHQFSTARAINFSMQPGIGLFGFFNLQAWPSPVQPMPDASQWNIYY